MLRAWLVICPLILPVAARSAQDDTVQKAKAKLAGVWVVESIEFLGKPADSLKGDRLTFTSDKLTIKSKAKEDVQIYQIDPGKKPKQIDFKCGDMAIVGICEIDDDTLRLCLSMNGKRPTAFDSRQGLLSKLRRAAQ